MTAPQTSSPERVAWNPQTQGSAWTKGRAGTGEASARPTLAVCDYAHCDELPRHSDLGWLFCDQHNLEHRAITYDEPWPEMKETFPRPLAPCGTTAAARRHQRNGEKCQVCADAARRAQAPHNPNGFRGSWYRPGAA